jgi:hypothetical protein
MVTPCGINLCRFRARQKPFKEQLCMQKNSAATAHDRARLGQAVFVGQAYPAAYPSIAKLGKLAGKLIDGVQRGNKGEGISLASGNGGSFQNTSLEF